MYLKQNLIDLGSPSEFWEYFEQISRIPRCSGEEEQIRDFIIREAKSLNFNAKIDKVGNLVIKIPSKSDNKSVKSVVLQCHMDMVCEKNKEIQHDFSKDPLKLKIVEIGGENWLTAEGTTLGADNGVGISYLLTLMKKINKGELVYNSLNLEFLFTVDEEVGLVGAFNIDKDLIKGKYLINLDSEEDDNFTIGCAGGMKTIGEIKIKYNKIEKEINPIPMKLSITGLLGGHSGVDIHRGRANAIKLMATILWKLHKDNFFALNSIQGGNRANAIPRECFVILFLLPDDYYPIMELFNKIKEETISRFSDIESNLEIKLQKLENFNDRKIFPDNLLKNLLHILYIMPNGPISMHLKIPDLVHTSTNLGSINIENDFLKIVTSQRSLEEISKVIICERIHALMKFAGRHIIIEHEGNYPGWEPDFNSELLKICSETFKELFDKDPNVRAIHAGLECGILKEHFPEMEAISIGPTVEGAHSPDERLRIRSVEKFWDYLIKLLDSIN
ncbi:MAG: aminoacyl-histidine dipeptidase [Promethearchaeota archaeon]|nr:MAG: aminoacyl-histidine dipeptidase [Candidatus Lokiarchaeota archaeon]